MATRDVVPRATGEGGIGTAAKQWLAGYFNNLYLDTVQMTAFLDEDDMASDSATSIASQQSIKKYVDDQILTADTLNELTDTNLTGPANNDLIAFDSGTSRWLDKQIAELADFIDEDSMATDSAIKICSQQSIKAYVDAQVATQLANVVEDTTPQLGGDLDLNSNNIDFPTTANISDCLDEDTMSSNSATVLATQQSIKAYADTKIDAAGTLACTGTIQWDIGANVASANPLVPGADGNYFHVTGTTNFAAINASQSQPGTTILLTFDGVLTMTHHATDLILPGEANITTVAGDRAVFTEESANNWRCIAYQRNSGIGLINPKLDDCQATDDNTDLDASTSAHGLCPKGDNTATNFLNGQLGWTSPAGGIADPGSSTDNDLVRWDGATGDAVQDSGVQVTDNGEMTNTSQPAFLAYNSSTDNNVTGGSTEYTLVLDTEVFDQNADFDGTSTFTAPVTGKYFLSASVHFDSITASAHSFMQLRIVTSNRTYIVVRQSASTTNIPSDAEFSGSVLADMDATDTAVAKVIVYAANQDVEVQGTIDTRFCGALIC